MITELKENIQKWLNNIKQKRIDNKKYKEWSKILSVSNIRVNEIFCDNINRYYKINIDFLSNSREIIEKIHSYENPCELIRWEDRLL